MESVFGEGNVEIVTFGNALAATAFLQGLAIDDLPDTSYWIKGSGLSNNDWN